MKQNLMFELTFMGELPKGDKVHIDLNAVFTNDDLSVMVKGFYDGEEDGHGIYCVRFLPEKEGLWTWKVDGIVTASGEEVCERVDDARGIVRTDKTHFVDASGKPFYPFGTTVYALASQSDELVQQTIESLQQSPFNKLRLCVFPKHYNYNHNEPPYYGFYKKDGADAKISGFDQNDGSQWDTKNPDVRFWKRFERILGQIMDAGIEIDLILFHSYDRWGFSRMGQAENLTYLDYLLRRFAAMPGLWWSLANEYDFCPAITTDDWCEIENFMADNDPYHHLLSNHNSYKAWDAGRKNITHSSLQTKVYPVVRELMNQTGKPVIIDECCYEGNLKEFWGSISGKEMAARFWRICSQGGYCTHGETFLPDGITGEDDAVVWWAKGGRLKGESPARIQWLRILMETLQGPIEPMPIGSAQMSSMIGLDRSTVEQLLASAPDQMRVFIKAFLAMDSVNSARFTDAEYEYGGHIGDDCYLWYMNLMCSSQYEITLPELKTYKVEVLDTWNMSRETVLEHVNGKIMVKLPGKEYMAILCTAE